MIKSYMSDPFGRWLLILLILIVTVCILFGFVIDSRGFSGNLLAELAGNGIAILVGFLLIDRFLEHRREQQWAKVRNFTLGAIAAHLCDIASCTMMYFPFRDHSSIGIILEGRNTPNSTTVTGFEHLLEQLRTCSSRDVGNKSISDVAVEFYEAVTWDLDQIQTVLTPRVVQSSTDQELIDALIEFDDARRRLHNSIIGHKLICTQSVFPDVLSLVQSSRRLYQALCRSWEPVSGDRGNFD
jgi:hypothetical protein